MTKQAVEKFSFKPTGPYTVLKEISEGTFGILETGILRKKKAISRAKFFFQNGNFLKVVVQDLNNNVIFTQEKSFTNTFDKDIRLRALLRLLLAGPKMAANFRHSILALFNEEYKDMFPVKVGDAWTPEEDEAMKILLELGAPDNQFIADLLGRSESAVSHRILRMGFKIKQVSNRPALFQ